MSDIRIVAGSPTDEETAAIAAVVTRLVVERSAAQERIPAAPAASLWMRSRRLLRNASAVDRGWE